MATNLTNPSGRGNCARLWQDRQSPDQMKKPNVRGPSPSRKAHLALREKLNRKFKPAPRLPSKSLDNARPSRRKPLAQHEQ
jgi:hypothetical protein